MEWKIGRLQSSQKHELVKMVQGTYGLKKESCEHAIVLIQRAFLDSWDPASVMRDVANISEKAAAVTFAKDVLIQALPEHRQQAQEALDLAEKELLLLEQWLAARAGLCNA